MSSFPNIVPSTSNVNAARCYESRSRSTPPPSNHERQESAFESSTTLPSTRCNSLQPTEESETTVLGMYHDGGTPDNMSSATLQDKLLWHDVGGNKFTRKLPSTIVPVLLQGLGDVSPSRSSLDGAQDALREGEENSDLPPYSAAQKGKWRARVGDDVAARNDWAGFGDLQINFLSAEGWVAHNRPILDEYAMRQPSVPLGRRLEVSIDEPSQFILGALHLLVNRDKPDGTDRSRRLGPQLIENFLDIERWAREYFRSRHATQAIDGDIPTLLTIIINNFYEGQVQLIDRIVDFALEKMQTRGRSTLCVEDFAFGFDFRMSQDLPFYVETCSRVRERFPTRPEEVHSTVEPVTTSSGRKVKPTKRAQEHDEEDQTKESGRQKKEKKPPKVKDKQAKSGLTRQPKTNPPRGSSENKAPESAPAPTKTSARTQNRAVRPSNLGLPPITPASSTPETTPQRIDDVKPKPSDRGSARTEKSGIMSNSNGAQHSSSQLKIKIPPIKSKGPAARSTPKESSRTTTSVSTPTQENVVRRSERTRSRAPRNTRGGGRGREAKEATTAKPPEATSVNVASTQTMPPLDKGDAVPSAVDTSKEQLATNATKKKNVAGGSNTGTQEAVENSGGAPLRKIDPGHSRRRKRNLDECAD